VRVGHALLRGIGLGLGLGDAYFADRYTGLIHSTPMSRGWWPCVALSLGSLLGCKPTDAQQADVRARFEVADKADAEPDRLFRALALATRQHDVDPSAKPCPVEWAPADRSALVRGLAGWLAEIEISKHPPPRGTIFIQADNVTIADHDASFDAIGSAARQRRRGLEAALLERKGELGELSGKEFVARAASILDAPLPREILIDLLSSTNPTLKDEHTFTGGFSVAHVYLYEHASARFICAGSFTAESSGVVESRALVGDQYWLNVNLYINMVDAATKSLRAL
jgi:hypothetical protein